MDEGAVVARRNAWVVPGAIVVAGVILAIAIYVVRSGNVSVPLTALPEMIEPVSAEDHIIGNPGAAVMIVEYSDIDSDDGKSFHAALLQLMTEYASGGEVAWTYRHLPLTTLHGYAQSHAEAAECARDQNKFLEFKKAVFLTPNTCTDSSQPNHNTIKLT